MKKVNVWVWYRNLTWRTCCRCTLLGFWKCAHFEHEDRCKQSVHHVLYEPVLFIFVIYEGWMSTRKGNKWLQWLSTKLDIQPDSQLFSGGFQFVQWKPLKITTVSPPPSKTRVVAHSTALHQGTRSACFKQFQPNPSGRQTKKTSIGQN